MSYTAEEMVNKLHKEENVLISVRTLNYYAYDKKMFPNLKKGKSAYTDEEYEILKRIVYLKNKTAMSLDEIKSCVSNDTCYNAQVNSVLSDSFAETERNSSINPQMKQSIDNTLFANSFSTALTDADVNSNFDNTVCYSNSASVSNFQAYDSCYTGSIPSNINKVNSQNFISSQRSVSNKTPSTVGETTVKINNDVTITVSSNISKEKLIEIINFINSK